MAKLCDPAGFAANTVKGLTCNLIGQCTPVACTATA